MKLLVDTQIRRLFEPAFSELNFVMLKLSFINFIFVFAIRRTKKEKCAQQSTFGKVNG